MVDLLSHLVQLNLVVYSVDFGQVKLAGYCLLGDCFDQVVIVFFYLRKDPFKYKINKLYLCHNSHNFGFQLFKDQMPNFLKCCPSWGNKILYKESLILYNCQFFLLMYFKWRLVVSYILFFIQKDHQNGLEIYEASKNRKKKLFCFFVCNFN